MRIPAHIISVIFHPLLMLTYMLLMLLVVNPFMFGYTHPTEADALILMVFLTSGLIPLIAILVMRAIGWVHSLEMPDRHERIGPYIVTGVLYLTLYLHLVKAKAFPEPLLICTLGTVIALFSGFIINNFGKISMHATAAGGLLSLTTLIVLYYSTDQFILPVPWMHDLEVPVKYLLYSVIILVGCICSARLISKKHSPPEVYAGFIVGFVSMWIATWFIG